MKKLPKKLWRVVKTDGRAMTFDDEDKMKALIAGDTTVTIGLYELADYYVAVKTVTFERKQPRKRRARKTPKAPEAPEVIEASEASDGGRGTE